jgi:hypothetical protein
VPVRFYAACVVAGLCAGSVLADDQLTVVGSVDVRWVHSTSDLSYLDGGLGKLRFDQDDTGPRLGRAFVASRLRVTDLVTVHAVVDAYGDHDRNPVDLSELWAEVRPFPTSALRWRVRVGAFYMPVSLENRGPGWSDVYSITPSALNTWIGEEFRTVGTEFEARWLGANSGYLGDVSLVAAAYAWNDPAGALIADRGFALSDRPSTLFGRLGRPPVTFYHEIDRRPGYYAGLSWRHHDGSRCAHCAMTIEPTRACRRWPGARRGGRAFPVSARASRPRRIGLSSHNTSTATRLSVRPRRMRFNSG